MKKKWRALRLVPQMVRFSWISPEWKMKHIISGVKIFIGWLMSQEKLDSGRRSNHADWRHSAAICTQILSSLLYRHPRRKVQWPRTWSCESASFLNGDEIQGKTWFELKDCSIPVARNRLWFHHQLCRTKWFYDDRHGRRRWGIDHLTYHDLNWNYSFRQLFQINDWDSICAAKDPWKWNQDGEYLLLRISSLAELIMLWCCECKRSVKQCHTHHGGKKGRCHEWTLNRNK